MYTTSRRICKIAIFLLFMMIFNIGFVQYVCSFHLAHAQHRDDNSGADHQDQGGDLKKPNVSVSEVRSSNESEKHTPPKPPLPVVWYVEVDKPKGSRGLIIEAINFLVPLFRLLPRMGWYSTDNPTKLRSNAYLKDLKRSDRSTMFKLFNEGRLMTTSLADGSQVKGSPFSPSLSTGFISIISEQPPEYHRILRNTGVGGARYKIGRAMYETTWIPKNWEVHINVHLDELWVPSRFAQEIFRRAGVRIPIYIVHEGFDGQVFTSNATSEDKQKIRTKFFPKCKADDLIFFSVAKMEERKGLDLLETAFEAIFNKEDPVCLYVKTNDNQEHQKYLSKLQKKGLRVYPVTKDLSTSDLAEAYVGADVYAAPTHGEGWGRPIMEAMAMGLPVITTYWSGPTEYLRPEYALLLHVTSLERAYKNEAYYLGGKDQETYHNWAKINMNELKGHLRWCLDHREELPAIGMKARIVMHDRFTRERVAMEVVERLREVNSLLQKANL